MKHIDPKQPTDESQELDVAIGTQCVNHTLMDLMAYPFEQTQSRLPPLQENLQTPFERVGDVQRIQYYHPKK